MRNFIELIKSIESTTKTNSKLEHLIDYFERAKLDRDKLWAIYILLGNKLSIPMFKRTHLKKLFCEYYNYSDEFFTENRSYVGDSAETMALLATAGNSTPRHSLTSFIENHLMKLDHTKKTSQNKFKDYWDRYDVDSIFVIHKLITGGLRIGLSKNLLIRALARYSELPEDILHQRLMGSLNPFDVELDNILGGVEDGEEDSTAYPFYLASPVTKPKETFSDPLMWRAEWKWDGIRVQVIKRGEKIFLWSRGGEIINDSFPDIISMLEGIESSFVLDGELLIIKNNEVQDFNSLQTRLRRKTVSKKLQEQLPANIMVYDLLELEGRELREESFDERLRLLDSISDDIPFQISPQLQFKTFSDLVAYRNSSREMKAEGLMIKNRLSTYKRGRKVGDWWKWKVDPFTLDLILTYAQAGSGRRSGLHTDYTFGIWNHEKKEIVTLTKAYSGLTDKELEKYDHWIKRNTLERYGPVRKLTPEKVFEVHFEGISASKRHNSGLALRFPRIHRVREDKNLDEANTLADAEKLLEL